MTTKHKWRSLATVLGLALAGAGMASCSNPTDLACPDLPLATDVRLDVTDSSSSEAIKAEQLGIIRAEAERIALCGHGYLRAQAFTTSSAATVTLFDGAVEAEGATQPARRRRLDQVIDPIMEEIEAAWNERASELPTDGTDVLGQLDLAAEYVTQHPDHHHRIVIHTDGLQTTGQAVTNDPAFTEEAAADLAARVSVPDLPGVDVTFAGIGRVAGDPPSSSTVSALKRFYQGACERTGATCLVVTDLATS